MSLSNLAALLARSGTLGGGLPAPILQPIPSRPLPVPQTLTGWLTGATAKQQQEAVLAWQQQVGRIQAANAAALAQHHVQQTQFQTGLFQTGLGGLQGGVSELMNPKPTVNTVGAGISRIVGAAGTVVGGLLGGPGGAAIGGALGEVGAAAFNAVEGLRSFSANLLQGNFEFAQFSSSMSRVQAFQNVIDIQRSQRMGEFLAPSAMRLAKERSQYERDVVEPQEKNLRSFWNDLAADYYAGGNNFSKTRFGQWTLGPGAAGTSNLPNMNYPWLTELGNDRFQEVYKMYGRPARFGSI